MEYTIPDVAMLTGKAIRTVREYMTMGRCGVVLKSYKNGKHRVTTDIYLHEFLLQMPSETLFSVSDRYFAPEGMQPLPEKEEIPLDLHLISIAEACNILQISDSRLYFIIDEGKLLVHKMPDGTRMIIVESLEEHLKRVETWHYKKAFDKAIKEVYPDVLADAYKEADRISHAKQRKILKLQEQRSRSQGKTGRPKGSKDSMRRRKRPISIQSKDIPEDYTLTPP